MSTQTWRIGRPLPMIFVFIRNFPLASATLAVQLSQGSRQQSSLFTRLDAKTRAKRPAEDWQRRKKGKRKRERERKVFPQAAATRYPLLSLVFFPQQVNDTTLERNAKERLPQETNIISHEHNVPDGRKRDTEMKEAIEESKNVHRRKNPFHCVP
jgi:hypothetical protein